MTSISPLARHIIGAGMLPSANVFREISDHSISLVFACAFSTASTSISAFHGRGPQSEVVENAEDELS